MPAIKELLIREDNYAQDMDKIVEPWLALKRSDDYIERVPGNRLHYTHYHVEDPRAVVLFSHGFTESEEKYAELVYYFLNMGYTVYFPEHCGHGYSYRLTDDPSLVHVDRYETYVEDLLAVAHIARQANPDVPLCLFAHSMGGGIGAAAAAQEPELFDKVLLHSPMIRPLTGGIPWGAAKAIAAVTSALGMKKKYIFGSKPYGGLEDFDTSCATSRARFDWYQQKRLKYPRLQTASGSLGWLKETGRLNRFLMGSAWQKITAPVLLLQAEGENMVSTEEQERFVAKLKKAGKTADLAVIKNARHEIFNSTDDVLAPYLEKVFAFFGS